MTSRDFAYWLQGFLELSGDGGVPLSAEQTLTIRKHVATVFIHEIDPSFPKNQQHALDTAHLGGKNAEGVVYRC